MSDFLHQGEFFSNAEAPPEIVFTEPKLSARTRSIHEKAIRRAKTYLIAEADLLESIIEIDEDRTYEKFGETYLTPYCRAVRRKTMQSETRNRRSARVLGYALRRAH